MGLTLADVIANNLLSEAVTDCIPEYCDCGAAIEFTESLSQIFCSNAMCAYRVAARLESMAKMLKVDGWGESTCQAVCIHYGLKSPYQVFLLPNALERGNICGSVSALQKKVDAICDMKLRQAKLWEVVKYAGMPSIETTAYKIFDGYATLSEAYADIERGQVPFIAEKLGIKNNLSGVMAVNVYNTLLQYKQELLFGEAQFKVYQASGETLLIAITDSVDGYTNKSEFINEINKRYSGKVNAMLMPSMSSSVDILIADGGTSSNKYQKAERINAKHLQELLNSGAITDTSLIGTFANERDIKPIGYKVFVTDSRSALARLDAHFM